MYSRVGHFNVIGALIVRDVMGRFGRSHLGFLWVILEPMILCVGVMAIWSAIKESVIHGIPIVAFVYTGYMPLTLWRHMTGPLVRLLHQKSAMLLHRPIGKVDILIARCMLEFLSTTSALVIIYFVVVSLGIVEPIKDTSLVLAGWLYAGWYFGAQGLLLSALSECWEPIEKFVQPANYLQLPISGCFTMVDWLPRYAQKLLLLNPSVNCFEMFRAGFFGASVTTYYDTTYLTICCTILTVAAGIALYFAQDRVEVN